MSEHPDLLVGGDDDAPTMTERASATRLGAAVLRHPRWSLGAVAALVLLAGAGAYLLTRPPDFDPTAAGVRVVRTGDLVLLQELDPRPSRPLERPDGRREVGATVWVARTVPGDAVRVVGVAGPGLAVTRVIDEVRDDDRRTPVRVVEVTDCSGRWWAATPDDYVLVVERTDAWGRATQVPLPLGEGARRWRTVVQGACAAIDAWVLAVVGASTDAVPGRPDPQVGWRLHNPTTHPVWVQAADLYGDAAAELPPVAIAAGAEATVQARALVTRCPDGVQVLDSPRGDGGPAPVVGVGGWWQLPVRVASQPWRGPDADSGDLPDASVVPVPADVARRVIDAVGHVCDGAPEVRARVVAVDRAVAVPPDLRWRLVLDVTSSADRVGVVGAWDDPNDGTGWGRPAGEVTDARPARAALREERARFSVVWTVPGCEYFGGTPFAPELVVVAESGARRYPVAAVLDARLLLAAVRTTCPVRS